MAQLIDPNELMYTKFEPVVLNHFIVYMEGIPSFMIKKIKSPSIEFGEVKLDHINVYQKFKGKGNWQDITMTLYQPIIPSGAQKVMEWIRTAHESTTGRDGYADFYKREITINSLGPIGDKVGEWIIHGAWVKNFDNIEFDWANDQHAELNITVAYDYAESKY